MILEESMKAEINKQCPGVATKKKDSLIWTPTKKHNGHVLERVETGSVVTGTALMPAHPCHCQFGDGHSCEGVMRENTTGQDMERNQVRYELTCYSASGSRATSDGCGTTIGARRGVGGTGRDMERERACAGHLHA